MEERKIKLATLALLTPITEALGDVIIPQLLSDASEEVKKIVHQADELLKNDSPAVTDREYLQSIFNVLNGNNGNMLYHGHILNDNLFDINYPVTEATNDQSEYRKNVTADINETLEGFVPTSTWLYYFCEMLESDLTYMPGILTDPDISLFDQAKLCAAYALCLADSPSDSSNTFLLYSMDFSGIQDFIYTIQSKGALKTLRARSFYLEILMENTIDDILESLDLPRINVLYSGGGHCYMLLPNNDTVKIILDEYNKRLNDWLLDKFDISLFVGYGYASCNSDALRNVPEGSYSDLFRTVSREISAHKTHRYDASQLIRINNRKNDDYTRECNVCKRLGKLIDDKCPICNAIETFSNDILNDNYFVVGDDPTGVPLPDNKYLKGFKSPPTDVNSKRYYRKRTSDNDGSYGLWVGDYTNHMSFEEMAEDAKSRGCIDRIGIIRADVDNLGSAISMGFDKTVGGNIMRTMALSRQLSLFFKSHIDHILSVPCFPIGQKKPDIGRSATVCYSGGDDLFVVGAWDDIIGFAVDISNAFARFTQGTLSISAGIGIYDHKYPISRIAYETAELEDMSKTLPGKNAVTLLVDGNTHDVTDGEDHILNISDGTYTWKEFEEEMIGDKYHEISDFFGNSDDRGMSFMYKLLELVRNQEEKINFARFVYVLSRLEPGKDTPPDVKARYKRFADKMTIWIKDTKDRRQLKTAMTLYAYMTRIKEDK